MRRRLKVQLVALFGICVAAYAWNVVRIPCPPKDPLPTRGERGCLPATCPPSPRPQTAVP